MRYARLGCVKRSNVGSAPSAPLLFDRKGLLDLESLIADFIANGHDKEILRFRNVTVETQAQNAGDVSLGVERILLFRCRVELREQRFPGCILNGKPVGDGKVIFFAEFVSGDVEARP